VKTGRRDTGSTLTVWEQDPSARDWFGRGEKAGLRKGTCARMMGESRGNKPEKKQPLSKHEGSDEDCDRFAKTGGRRRGKRDVRGTAEVPNGARREDKKEKETRKGGQSRILRILGEEKYKDDDNLYKGTGIEAEVCAIKLPPVPKKVGPKRKRRVGKYLLKVGDRMAKTKSC